MKNSVRFLPLGSLIVPILLGCETTRGPVGPGHMVTPCADWSSLLGESHECSYADGGALSPDRVRAEITQKVVRMGQSLPQKDYGLAVLLFHYDGTYQARKLHFTGFFEERGDAKHYLVFAEDSAGAYRVEDNGVITLDTPMFSTCAERKKGSDRIHPHLQTYHRAEPYRTTRTQTTAIVFETRSWLGGFLGSSYWDGDVESRSNFVMPPFPSRIDHPLAYDFDGFQADIHYGCLHQGFGSFAGPTKEALATVREFRYTQGINPKDLRPGTRMIVSP